MEDIDIIIVLILITILVIGIFIYTALETIVFYLKIITKDRKEEIIKNFRFSLFRNALYIITAILIVFGFVNIFLFRMF
tara:strand:+ start:273 stop:509 length:237 start_codon:yes stop_codon:yes gene_type:complete